MLSPDDIQYAIENTQVIRQPARRIKTFGTTSFQFILVTELMDGVNEIRVRDGSIQAERPQLITPDNIQKLLLDGFGSKAEEYIDWLREHDIHPKFLKYGFQIRKSDVNDRILHDPLVDVLGRITEDINAGGDDQTAVIQGIDEGWEVCLLKFTIDLIQRSAGENMDDFRKHGSW